MSDTENLIEELRKYRDYTPLLRRAKLVDKAIDKIEELSALYEKALHDVVMESKKNMDDGWIACSKQMPPLKDENDELLGSIPCIIQLKDGTVLDRTYTVDYDYDDWDNAYDIIPKRWRSVESSGEYADDYRLDEVAYWQPLPKPYKGE